MKVREQIRVLVIDDSAFSRQTITRMLETSPLVEVIGCARDGEEALRKTLDLRPDLITLDLEMPGMSGFTVLRLIMASRPTPVLVISGRTGEEEVFKALETFQIAPKIIASLVRLAASIVNASPLKTKPSAVLYCIGTNCGRTWISVRLPMCHPTMTITPSRAVVRATRRPPASSHSWDLRCTASLIPSLP